VSGDTGFATEENLAAIEKRRIAAYLPPACGRHGQGNAGRGIGGLCWYWKDKVCKRRCHHG
jgi:hypothetical protein